MNNLNVKLRKFHSDKKNEIFRNKFKKRSIRLVQGKQLTLWKEIQADLNRGKNVPCSTIGKLSAVYMATHPQIDLKI